MPKALTSHLNGNAVYNLTNNVFDDIVQQLEDGDGSTPYDCRIAQLALSHGYPGLKETKLIANYAATNILPKHISPDAVIIHGANVFEPWSAKDEVCMVSGRRLSFILLRTLTWLDSFA